MSHPHRTILSAHPVTCHLHVAAPFGTALSGVSRPGARQSQFVPCVFMKSWVVWVIGTAKVLLSVDGFKAGRRNRSGRIEGQRLANVANVQCIQNYPNRLTKFDKPRYSLALSCFTCARALTFSANFNPRWVTMVKLPCRRRPGQVRQHGKFQRKLSLKKLSVSVERSVLL